MSIMWFMPEDKNRCVQHEKTRLDIFHEKLENIKGAKVWERCSFNQSEYFLYSLCEGKAFFILFFNKEDIEKSKNFPLTLIQINKPVFATDFNKGRKDQREIRYLKKVMQERRIMFNNLTLSELPYKLGNML